MRIAYLINGYPSVSHSFIRREILALERLGVEVLRVSVRRAAQTPDPVDQREATQTTVLLDHPFGLWLDFIVCLLRRPIGLIRAAHEAVTLARGGDRGLLAHVAYLLEACRLSRLLHAQRIRHIHAHFGTNPAAVAMLTRLISGVTYSFTVHGPEEFDRPVALKLGRKIEQAAFVVAVSSFGRSQLMRWCGADLWNKLHVVRCGVDRDFLDDLPQAEPDNRTLVCVGRLCEQKGQLLLIEAFSRLRDAGADARLVLAGDGPMRSAIERRIADLGLQKYITITGWLSGSQVRDRLLRSRAMVLPSFAEGLPVVIMEAFALRRPVITTYIAGIPELVRNGINGWLIPAGSIQRLAESMDAALTAPAEELARMGESARASVVAMHEVNREAGVLCRYFERVLTPELAEHSGLAVPAPRGAASATQGNVAPADKI